MVNAWKKIGIPILITLVVLTICLCAFMLAFRRPCRKTVLAYASSPPLVYSVIKAESGFSETAVSEAGAVGLMQIMPSTAQFVCERENIAFEAERLKEGEYNVMLGCKYLDYLFSRFSDVKTALAAYNAGEGIVSAWLKNNEYSDDGITLKEIPYRETKHYVKKVLKYQKIYSIFD